MTKLEECALALQRYLIGLENGSLIDVADKGIAVRWDGWLELPDLSRVIIHCLMEPDDAMNNAELAMDTDGYVPGRDYLKAMLQSVLDQGK